MATPTPIISLLGSKEEEAEQQLIPQAGTSSELVPQPAAAGPISSIANPTPAQQPMAQPQVDQQPVAQPVAESTEEEPSYSVGDLAQDYSIDILKGAVELGKSVVGLGDMATAGYLGRGMRAVGYNPEETNNILTNLYSDARKFEENDYNNAEGFWETAGSLVSNPAMLVGKSAEMAPAMLGMMGAARYFAARSSASAIASATAAGVAPKVAAQIGNVAAARAATIASSVAEGMQQAGSSFEDYMAEGVELGKAYAGAIGSGITTGAFAFLGGRAGEMLGLGNVDALVASNAKGFAAKFIANATQEGVLEELPQSITEQMWDNYVHDRPITDGVGKAAATGMILGAAAGGGMGAVVPAHIPGPMEQAAETIKGRLMPLDQDGAIRRAQTLTTQGIPHGVVPHPQAQGKFAVVPMSAPVDRAQAEELGSEMIAEDAAPLGGALDISSDQISTEMEEEHRRSLALRKAIDHMSPEEAQVAVRELRQIALTSRLTGLNNKDAFFEAHGIDTLEGYDDSDRKAPFILNIDSDGLKLVNDLMGHASGDTLLRLTGTALNEEMAELGESDTMAYHLSGDEFTMTGSDSEFMKRIAQGAQKRLKQATIYGETEDGQKVELHGIGFSFGIADSMKEAENGLKQNKAEREASGERAGRGELHEGVRFIDRPEQADQGDAAPAQEVSTLKQIDAAAHEAATSPRNDLEVTQEQLESGDYPKGRFTLDGDTFSIENPKGSVRKGTDETGRAWEQKLSHHYGDWEGTKGADGDPIDVFFGNNPKAKTAFVINQDNPNTGKFDEHKVMRGFSSKEEAEAAYLASYEKGWKGLRNIVEVPVEELRDWATSGDTSKPFATGEVKKYKSTTPIKDWKGEEVEGYRGSKQKRYFSDNPQGRWLEDERKAAAKGGGLGALTAGIRRADIDPNKLIDIKGAMNEHTRIKKGDERVAEIAESMKQKGYNLQSDAPIFITVDYNGTPKISEGNHRLRAAIEAGLETVPVEVRYFAGGELTTGYMDPSRVKRLDKGAPSVKKPNSLKKFDMQPAKDGYNTKYKRVPTSELNTGITKVTGPEDAAHILAPLRKGGEEVFYALVLDKDGNVLDVQNHSKGTRDGASVYPEVVGPAIAGVKGASSVYFSHNHPSGISNPSSADFAITERLGQFLDGANVSVAGHVVLGHGTEANFFGLGAYEGQKITITPKRRSGKVAVTEKRLRKVPPKERVAVTSPDSAVAVVDAVESSDALILLDNRHQYIGALEMTTKEMDNIRGKNATEILKAIDETNAVAGIIKTSSEGAAKNLSAYLNNTAKMRVLDIITLEGNSATDRSLANRGVMDSALTSFNMSPPPGYTEEPYRNKDGSYRRNQSGDITGAPAGVKTDADIDAIVKKMVNNIDGMFKRDATRAQHSMDWYEISGAAVRKLTHNDQQLAERIVRLLARFSTNTQVGGNTTFTVKAAYQLARGEEVYTGRFPNDMKKDMDAIINAEEMDKSVPGVDDKVMNFYRNLYDATFQTERYEDATTMDMWMGKLYGYKKGADGYKVSGAQYRFANMITQRIAEAYNKKHDTKVYPRQIQAALWGYVRDGKTLAEGKPLTKVLDFSEYLSRASEHITVEGVPSKNLPGNGIINASPQIRAAYTKAVMDVNRTEDHVDELLEKLHAPLYGNEDSYGSFEGIVNTNKIASIIADKVQRTDGKAGMLYDREVADLYSLAAIYLYSQDAVPWFRLEHGLTRAKAGGNVVSKGVAVKFGSKPDAKTVEAFYTHLREHVPDGELTVVGNSVLAINFRDPDTDKPWGMSDKEFIAAVATAANTFDGDVTEIIKDIRAEGAYHAIEDYGTSWANPEEAIAKLEAAIIKAGRRDLLEWLRDRRAQVEKVRADFERGDLKKYQVTAAQEKSFKELLVERHAAQEKLKYILTGRYTHIPMMMNQLGWKVGHTDYTDLSDTDRYPFLPKFEGVSERNSYGSEYASKYRQATPKEADTIIAALRDLMAAGMPASTLQFVDEIGIDETSLENENDAAFIPAQEVSWGSFKNSIWFNSNEVEVVAATGDITLSQAMRAVLAHEVGHAIDVGSAQDGNSHATDSPLFRIDPWGFEIADDFNSPIGYKLKHKGTPFGPVMMEAVKLFQSPNSFENGLQDMLAYPLLNLLRGEGMGVRLLGSKVKLSNGDFLNVNAELKERAPAVAAVLEQQVKKNIHQVQGELFAQLHSMFYTVPEEMAKFLPKGYALMQEVQNAAAQETTRTGLDKRLRAILRTPSTKLRPYWVQQRLFPSRAGEVAGLKEAGGSVGGNREVGSAVSKQGPAGKTSELRRYNTQSVENNPAFAAWFGNSKVVDESGKPLELFHGTTHDFDAFNTSYANPESYMGAGFYFTDSLEDVNPNYAGEGPDLTIRIEQEKDRIDDEDMLIEKYAELNGLDYGEAETKWYELDGDTQDWYKTKAAKDALGIESQGAIMPVFLKMESPVEVTPSGGTTLEVEWDADYYKGDGMAADEVNIEDYTDEDGDVDEDSYQEALDDKAREMFYEDYNPELTGNAAELGDIIRDTAYEFGVDGAALQQKFMEETDYPMEYRQTAYDLSMWLRQQDELLDAYDDEGRLTAYEMVREVFERMGFDGIIMDAEAHFGRRVGNFGMVEGMFGVDGAKHYIAFSPSQIKSSIGNTGEYTPSPQITMSNKSKGFGREAAAVQKDVDAITSGWKAGPTIKVASHRSMLPARLQKEMLRSRGKVEAVFDADTNTVHLLADALPTSVDVARVLLHEVFGHWAPTNKLGSEFKPLLERVYQSYGDKRLQGIADRHGVSLATEEGRLIAAQEKMAEIAELGINPTLLNKLSLMLKNILNKLGIKVKLSNGDIRAILANAGRMVYEGDSVVAGGKLQPLFSQTSVTFYSQMQEHLRNKLPGKGQPAQLKMMVNNMAKKGQFKQEELDWSGLNEWLDEQDGIVTKEQVVEFLQENAIEIEEVTLGGQDPDEEGLDTSLAETGPEGTFGGREYYQYEASDGYQYEARTLGEGDGWTLYDERGFKVKDEEGFIIVDEIDEMHEYAAVANEKRMKEPYEAEQAIIKADGPAYHEEWTERGEKQNYRELLLRMPVKQETLTPEEQSRLEVLRRKHRAATQRPEEFSMSSEQMATYEALNSKMRRLSSEYGKKIYQLPAAHFGGDKTNVLASIRFDTRTDGEGKKVLFIEEVQSDWHQDGRKKGYRDTKSKLPTNMDVVNAYNDMKPLLQQEDFLGFDTAAEAISAIMSHDDYAERWEISSPEAAAAISHYKEVRQQVDGVGSSRGTRELVADAPFKTSWPMLAMKRMIRYAAENGYDRIAWTSGEQQADRYDLSKQVDRITSKRAVNLGGNEPRYDVTAWRKGSAIIDKKGISQNEVEGLVGKDIAKKLIDRADNAGGKWGGHTIKKVEKESKTLTGIDLMLKRLNALEKKYDSTEDPAVWSAYEKQLEEVTAKINKQMPEGYRMQQTHNGWEVHALDEHGGGIVVASEGESPQAAYDMHWGGQGYVIHDSSGTPVVDKLYSLPYGYATQKGAEAALEEMIAKGKIDTSASVSGIDLKIGGEGMVAFYDKMLPTMVGKYIKKWGGKVGSTTIAMSDSDAIFTTAHHATFDTWNTWRNGDIVGPDYATKEEADAAAERLNKKAGYHPYDEQWSVDMTPEMRSAAMDGQVLFSATDEQVTKTIKQRYINMAEKILNPVQDFMSPVGQLPQSEKYIGMRQGVMGDIAKVNQVVKRIHDILSELSGDEMTATYKYLTSRDASPTDLPSREITIKRSRGTGRLLQQSQKKNLRREIVAIKRLINATGKELVDRGLIPQSSYEHYADRYLPRLYLAHLLPDNDFNAMVSGNGKKVSDLGYTKGRNEDLSEVYRILKGEIKNPAYLASKTVGTSLRDVAILDFLNEVSKVREWILPNLMVEWNGSRVSAEWLKSEGNRILGQAQYQDERDSKVSRIMGAEMIEKGQQALDTAGYSDQDYKDYRQVPSMPRYGGLRGVWVRKEIYNDLIGGVGAIQGDTVMESLLGTGGIGTKITQLWKMSKVALNPPSQVRNFMSNLIMVSLHGGVPLHKLPGLFHRAFKQVRDNGKYWRHAQHEGVTESTFTASELFRIDRDLLKLKQQSGQLSTWEHFLMVAGVVGEYAGDLYQFSEAIGKTMMMIHGMENNGLTPRDAAIAANKTLFDYSFVGPNVKYLRNAPVGMPFVTFYYKALPNMLEVLLKHPQRFLPYMMIPAIIAQAIAKSHDVDDDDIEALKEALPNWVREKNSALILPVKDARGRWQAFDYGYFLPWGMFTDVLGDVAKGEVGDAIKTTGLFGGPLAELIVGIKTGKDSFTGRKIYHDADPAQKQFVDIMNYLWRMAAPTWTTDIGAAAHTYRALSGHVDPRTGDPTATLGQAMGRWLGINVYPIEPEYTRARNLMQFKAELNDIKMRLRSRVRDQNLSGSERMELAKAYKELMVEKAREIKEYEQASRVHPNLRVK